MSKLDNNFFDYNFFVIDSNNLKDITSRLYGYVIIDDKFYINGTIKEIPRYANGAYVNIYKDNGSIRIQQDCNGSCGLYIFRNQSFFVLSNSFLCLLRYLHGKVRLSLNNDFAKYFIADDLASLSVSETLINEIQLLPKNAVINIDIDKPNNVKIDYLNDDFQKVSLDSKEGIEILDGWYNKWQNLLLSLQENNEKVLVDLTGGFDSRATFSIFNHPKIDFDKDIEVRSNVSGLHTFKEDYEIALMIAKNLGFELNTPLSLKRYPLSVETSINASFLVKLGIHKQMYFKNEYFSEKRFYFTGFGGESIRRHWINSEKFINDRKKMGNLISLDCSQSVEKIILRSFQDVKSINKNYSDTELMRKFYENTRLRSHFGTNIIENFLSNTICLNPLMDIELQKIYTDNNLLLCTIYDRYLKNISNIKFDSNKRLEAEHVDMAKSINDKYPYKPNKHINTLQIIDDTKVKPNMAKDYCQPRLSMMDYFGQDKVKNEICKSFGYEVYRKAELNWIRGGIFLMH